MLYVKDHASEFLARRIVDGNIFAHLANNDGLSLRASTSDVAIKGNVFDGLATAVHEYSGNARIAVGDNLYASVKTRVTFVGRNTAVRWTDLSGTAQESLPPHAARGSTLSARTALLECRHAMVAAVVR